MNTPQKIMITGDVASGKSNFAEILGKKMSLPVVHLDELQRRHNRDTDLDAIRQEIIHHASQPSWIIEGNAFRKDLDYRIKQADIIFLFDSNPFTSYLRHVNRWYRHRFLNQQLSGGVTTQLLPLWFFHFIFFLWPKRKKQIKKLFRQHNKRVITFRTYQDVNHWLDQEAGVVEW